MADFETQSVKAMHSMHSQSGGVAADGGGVYTLRSREVSVVGVGAVSGSTTARGPVKDISLDSETGSVDSRDIKKRQVRHFS